MRHVRHQWLCIALTSLLLLTGCGEDPPSPQDTSAPGDTASISDAQADASGADASTDTGSEDTTTPDGGDDAGSDTNSPEDIQTPEDTNVGPPPECTGPCDCEQGHACVDGKCTLGNTPVYCCTQEGCPDNSSCTNADGTGGICGVETSPAFGQVVFNEILTDGAVDGDPNGDGDKADKVGDQFVEIANRSGEAVDLSGYQLLENDLPIARHTFAAGTTLAPGKVIVVFGGGTAPDDTDSAQFVTINAVEAGIPFGLHLDNTDDALRLIDSNGLLVAIYAYGTGAPHPAISDQSATRQPDLTGEWVPHSDANPDHLFSPGTRADGSSF